MKPWEGWVREVRIWNRALDPYELLEIADVCQCWKCRLRRWWDRVLDWLW